MEMREQGHPDRGSIHVVTINSGSFQRIRKSRQGREDPPGMGSAKGNWLAQPRSSFQLTWRSLANDPCTRVWQTDHPWLSIWQ